MTCNEDHQRPKVSWTKNVGKKCQTQHTTQNLELQHYFKDLKGRSNMYIPVVRLTSEWPNTPKDQSPDPSLHFAP